MIFPSYLGTQFKVNLQRTNMKAFLAMFLSWLAVGASAWLSSVGHEHKLSSTVHFARTDSSKAVADALRISKEFGASSEEARVAWDIVEELDASDNSAAVWDATPNLSEKELASQDYAGEVRALAYLLQDTKEKLSQMKALASNLKQLELSDPSLSKLPAEAAPLKTVIAEAKAAMEAEGPNSPEAIKAWENVENCVDTVDGTGECSVDSTYRYSAKALKAHHYYDAVVDSEFLEEAVQALDTLDSLRRFIQIENNRLSGGGLSL